MYQKWSALEIAEKLGVGQTVVWKRLKEFGITLEGYEHGGHRRKTGRIFSDEHRKNLSIALRKLNRSGERAGNWKGGMTEKNLALRRTAAYIDWKEDALRRADYKCHVCGRERWSICKHCGHKVVLHVHHKLSFSRFPEHRFDPKNSEVLCSKCHSSRHHGKLGETGKVQNG